MSRFVSRAFVPVDCLRLAPFARRALARRALAGRTASLLQRASPAPRSPSVRSPSARGRRACLLLLGAALAAGLVLTTTLALTTRAAPPAAPPPPRAALEPAASERVAPAAFAPARPADSLTRRAAPGDVLVVSLPDALAGRAVAAYAVVRAPSLSWAVGRSFFWRVPSDATGAHRILLAATPADTTAPPDTLLLRVDIR